MKTAFAVWNNRIAPVFDVARRVIVVGSAAAGRDVQTQVLLTGDPPLQKALQLSELGVDCLVCGAISRPLKAVLIARGIQVVACVAGDVQAVIDAWRREPGAIESFAMAGRRQRRSRQSNRYQK
jgi:predicted Fe-Mo cluster-binding NifX family protein